ncbi:MAG: efflux RND transporter periplasmic adaptor subunit [Bacteroidales bacterium]
MSIRRIFFISLIPVVIVATGYIAFKKLALFAPPSINLSQYRTAEVDIGTVFRTVEAEGVVEPQSEVLLLSPASSIIKQIAKVPGSHVDAYQTILRLDPKPIQDEIASIEDQLEVKRNNLHKNRLNARSTRLDLDYNVEMKKLRITSLKSEVADQEELLNVGGISPARFEKTKQELTLAEKELEMILSKNSIRLKQLEAEEQGLKLQIDIQEKELETKNENLSKTTVRAPSAGIVMSINGKEGEKVNRDQLLVRLSDLSSFKINGTVADEYAAIMKTGNTVFAVIDREKLVGQIGNISPEVQGSKISFDVYLENSNHAKLLANMQVPLLIVRRMKEGVPRIQNGDGLGKGRRSEVYVIEGTKAVRKVVSFGMRGLDHSEISSGIQIGDKVIISDVAAFRGRPEIDIIN